ncbi:MAG: hypothetical protein AMXMBFR7_31050 [Planctomycetota bacterium]
MGSVLSKEEMDALNDALKVGRVDTQGNGSPAALAAKPYDFQKSIKFPARSRALFQLMHEGLARHLGRELTSLLNLNCESKLTDLQVLAFKEFDATLPSNATLLTFQLSAFELPILMVIHPRLSIALLDRFLGGKGAVDDEARATSELESEVLEETVGLLLEQVRGAWKRLADSPLEGRRRFANRQLLQFVAGEDTVVVASVEVKLPESTGLLTICYAERALELADEHSGRKSDREAEAQSEGPAHVTTDLVERLSVDVEAFLLPIEIPVREVMFLQAGDVLMFDHQVPHPVELRVSGGLRFEGYMGQHGDRVMCAITERH